MGFDFAIIDFETSNSNYNSACSIGIIILSNNEIVDKYYTLIQPPSLDFNQKNIDIHGIRPDDVINAPKFNEVWSKINKYFNGDYIVTAYNAVFDMTVLKACLKEYDIDYPKFEYFCSLQLAKKLYHCDNYKLDSVCNHLNITLDDHHNSLYDSLATAEILKYTINYLTRSSWKSLFSFFNNLNWNNFIEVKEVETFKTSKSRFVRHVSISSIEASSDDIDCNNVFYNKNIVFTGELSSLSRKDAMQKVVDMGGVLKSSVSKKTNYVVVGIQDKSIVGEDGMSSKERKAMDLVIDGYPIRIIDENEFLSMIKSYGGKND